MDIVIDVGEVARALGVLAQRVRAAIAIGTLRALPRMAEILQREVSRQCPGDTRRLLRSSRAAPGPAHNAAGALQISLYRSRDSSCDTADGSGLAGRDKASVAADRMNLL